MREEEKNRVLGIKWTLGSRIDQAPAAPIDLSPAALITAGPFRGRHISEEDKIPSGF